MKKVDDVQVMHQITSVAPVSEFLCVTDAFGDFYWREERGRIGRKNIYSIVYFTLTHFSLPSFDVGVDCASIGGDKTTAGKCSLCVCVSCACLCLCHCGPGINAPENTW